MRRLRVVRQSRSAVPRSLRVVPELRAVHVERFAGQSDSALIYLDTNFDLGETPRPANIRPRSFLGALVAIVSSRAEVLELPEPLWMRFLPKNIALGLAWKVSGVLARRKRRLVTYAMENNDLATLLGGGRRLPRWVVAAAARIIGTYVGWAIDRIAYASPAAEAAYRVLPGAERVASRSILELPSPALLRAGPPERRGEVVFAGVLEPRKGIVPLLKAWSRVEATLPDARLTLIGPGSLAPTATSWARRAPGSRRYLGHVERAGVLERVADARCVVAPSVRDGRWREQIGLPIKEALAAGATVVTTDQTGLAPWLKAHSHHVVPASKAGKELVADLAAALVAALHAPIEPEKVLASLPVRDGRLEADRWLHDREAPASRPAPALVSAPAVDSREPAETVVTIVNPLGGALDHYTRSLVTTLENAGARVEVHVCDEPSVSGRSRAHWVRSYVGLLRSARRATRGEESELVLVTWPVLGYLDLVILRFVLGAGIAGRIVFHDPKPLVAAVGYSKFSAALARLAARRHRVVVHSATAHAAVAPERTADGAAILPLPVTLRSQTPPERRDRPVVRVLGQFKVDRDLEVLRHIGARLGDDYLLEVHGRGWPLIDGWSVHSGFVSEADFDRLMATSAVVLIPYRHFFQSDVAVRCVELGVPFIGPRESSLREMLPESSPLLVANEGGDDRERGRRWVTAIESACSVDAADFRRQTAGIEAANIRAYAAWLEGLGSR